MLKNKPCDETEIDIKYSCVHNKLLRNGTHDLPVSSCIGGSNHQELWETRSHSERFV